MAKKQSKATKQSGAKRKPIEPKTIGDLRAAEYNPRDITDEALAGLSESIAAFGDLSGIVFNKRTGNLVAGHQRVQALRTKHGDAIDITNAMKFTNPTLKTPSGDFAIRVVEWDEDKEKLANIAANNPHIQGQFTDGLQLLISDLKNSDVASLLTPLNIDALLKSAPASGDGRVVLFDENVPTEHECPKCHYKWSGGA